MTDKIAPRRVSIPDKGLFCAVLALSIGGEERNISLCLSLHLGIVASLFAPSKPKLCSRLGNKEGKSVLKKPWNLNGNKAIGISMLWR